MSFPLQNLNMAGVQRSLNDARIPPPQRRKMKRKIFPGHLRSLSLELLQWIAGSLSCLDISNLVAAAPCLYLAIDKDFSPTVDTDDGARRPQDAGGECHDERLARWIPPRI